MQLPHLIDTFDTLGKRLLQGIDTGAFEDLFRKSFNENGWFSEDNIKTAFQNIAVKYLDVVKLEKWISVYSLNERKEQKTIAIVMAGNIPLAGFHDLLTVLISGNKAQLKLSSKDSQLMKFIISQLTEINPEIKENISVVEKLQDFDAVIATGSNNTSRYFDYYFGKYPHIIRKNRVSIAMLNGKETYEELYGLGKDIFTFFGLGCRNVSSIWIPKKYDISVFYEGIADFGYVIQHKKYRNNYDYYKSIFLLNKEKHLDNGFLMLKESDSLYSLVSTLHYRYYDDPIEMLTWLNDQKDNIQCIVGNMYPEMIPFGLTQSPELWEFADKVDTMDWLLNLS